MSDADGLRLTPKAKVECHSRYVLKCLFSPDSWYVVSVKAPCVLFVYELLCTTVYLLLPVRTTKRKFGIRRTLVCVRRCQLRVRSGCGIALFLRTRNTSLQVGVEDFLLLFLICLSLASSDGLARLWSIDHGAIKREYQGHQKAIVCLAFYDGSTDA